MSAASSDRGKGGPMRSAGHHRATTRGIGDHDMRSAGLGRPWAPLRVNGVRVRRDDCGRLMLVDLRRAAGGDAIDSPCAWAFEADTGELMREARRGGDVVLPMQRRKVGNERAVFVVEGLAYAYAAWVGMRFWRQFSATMMATKASM